MANGAVVAGAAVPERGLLKRSLRWPILLAIWSVPGLIQASQNYLWSDKLPFLDAVTTSVPPWLYWAVVSPLIFSIACRYRFERRTWPLSLAVHLISLLVLSAGHIVFSALFLREVTHHGFYVDNPLNVVLTKMALKNMQLEVLTYGGVLAAAYAVEYHRQFRERSVAAAQLETRLAQAQLEALKMQLHPHFLFNTLHAIAVLVRKQDTQGSVRMITGLSDLLRLALDTVGQQLVPLKQEMDFVGRYLEIEKIRFQDRMTVTTEIAPGTLDALVPNLVLQPLVENAIRHGISARAEPGTIEIRSRRDGDNLVLTVRDDGNGLRDGWRPGVGMSNVRARLLSLYPGRHTLEMSRGEHGGTVVTVVVPYEEEEAA